MARASTVNQQRQLSLTEELEKLEQQITLTLQEIDHNFSQAHRIVTSSILPVVEQYAAHSKNVWEGSKFWKQFFESSANVSLSGYEEDPSIQHDITDTTGPESSQADGHATPETSQSYSTPSAQHISTDSIADLDISNMTLSPSKSSTPRPTTQRIDPTDQTATFADYPSPYEALREEMDVTGRDETEQDTANAPHTPGPSNPAFSASQLALTPQSSPYLPPPPTSIPRPSTIRKKTDPLLNRVLDRNYRVQATPLTGTRYRSPQKGAQRVPSRDVGHTPDRSNARNALLDSTLSSSSPMAPPELHAELFSPVRQARTPGVSILSPMRQKARPKEPSESAPAYTPEQPRKAAQGIWEDSDEEDSGLAYDASPPKTMQFHVPQSRLMQTPAKEASRRIVDDILSTAGVGQEDEEDEFELDMDLTDYGDPAYAEEEASPSVVRKAVGLEDETF